MITILIVDDRPVNREVLAMLLEEKYYQILEADNGIQAIELLLNNKVDLVITDIAMPEMDGLSLVKKMQTIPILSEIPVIFYSATYKSAEALRLANANNVKYVLTKPCDPEVILSTIFNALQADEQKPSLKDDIVYTAEKNMNNKIDEKRERLEHINLRLTHLIEIGLNMSSQHDMEKLGFVACKGGRQFLNACYTGILVHDPNNILKYQAFNINRENEFSLYTFSVNEPKDLLKEIFLDKDPICVHSPIIDFAKIGLNNVTLPITSFLIVPIKTARAHYGYMYFVNKFNVTLFNISDQRLMMTLADKLALNYENLVLFKEKEQNTKILEEEIKQRKELEETAFHHKYHLELAELSRVTSMGEMASTLAHELNQPLTAILTYSQTCIRKLQNRKIFIPEVIAGLKSVVEQAKRAGTIIHRMKDFVRKGNLLLQNLNINDILLNLLPLIQYEGRNTNTVIKLDCAKLLPLVYVDKLQIEQVILNLVRNAIEALNEANVVNPQITIQTVLEANNAVAISVVDNGNGFSEELAENLFSPYVTTKPTGTGMGLAISRTIVEAHGGQLSAARLDNRTCFKFTLPYKQPEGLCYEKY